MQIELCRSLVLFADKVSQSHQSLRISLLVLGILRLGALRLFQEAFASHLQVVGHRDGIEFRSI